MSALVILRLHVGGHIRSCCVAEHTWCILEMFFWGLWAETCLAVLLPLSWIATFLVHRVLCLLLQRCRRGVSTSCCIKLLARRYLVVWVSPLLQRSAFWYHFWELPGLWLLPRFQNYMKGICLLTTNLTISNRAELTNPLPASYYIFALPTQRPQSALNCQTLGERADRSSPCERRDLRAHRIEILSMILCSTCAKT